MFEAGELIPAHKKPTTFISLIATAELRLLELEPGINNPNDNKTN